jgi:hypothetical protein
MCGRDEEFELSMEAGWKMVCVKEVKKCGLVVEES